jgi:hypothetical protein
MRYQKWMWLMVGLISVQSWAVTGEEVKQGVVEAKKEF